MKTKHIIALTAAIICIAILSVSVVLSLGKKPEAPDAPDTEQQEEPAVNNETDPPAPETDQEGSNTSDTNGDEGAEVQAPKDDDTENDTQAPEVDDTQNDTQDPPVSEADTPAAANPVDTATKAGIERILNDPFMILVNRERKVSSDYTASDLVYFNDYQLNSTCSAALRKLVNAGRSAGYNYILYSGYRTYSSQYNKYYNKIAGYKEQGYSEEEAVRLTDQYYAPPGGSEHHTGLAADVCISSVVNKYGMLHEDYEYTEEFTWFSQNAHKYGFILRYPKGKESITGYNYEPWHYRYVGVDIATDIYNRGVTLEEYVYELETKLKTMN